MDKKIFEENFIDCLKRNFDKSNKYFDYEYKVFFELSTQIFQISKCLILELDYAAITLTNNLLERLLKNALIYNKIGISEIPIEKWNDVFGEADKKYSSCKLGNTIELCKKETIINQRDKELLFETIRNQIRNGFSHSEPAKILANLPDTMKMYQGDFSSPNKFEKVELNPKTIIPLQSLSLDNFTKANARKYFDYVFHLMERIEFRLMEIHKRKNI